MKKKLLILLSALTLLLAGCGQKQSSQKLQIVAAIFPEYDWVRQIVGDDDSVELTLLVDDGVDPHSFQPSVKDMVAVSQCDLLVFGGGESDEWLEELLRGKTAQQAAELCAATFPVEAKLRESYFKAYKQDVVCAAVSSAVNMAVGNAKGETA